MDQYIPVTWIKRGQWN